MGSVSSPDLAVAVADAGGIGSITALGMTASQVDTALAGMAKRTNGVLAANFLTAQFDYEAIEAAAAHARIIDFFWADPDPKAVDIAHTGGALVTWQVGSLAEAKAAVDANCDMLAVQGLEAGGHVRGTVPLLPLLTAVVDAVDVPVIAAGGIGNARTVAAVVAAGAAGVRVGTRFIATTESGAHRDYKQAVIDAGLGDSEITDAFSLCPLCATSPRARVLRRCIDAARALETDVAGEAQLGDRTIALPKGSGMPPGASATGHIDAMALYASDSAAFATRVQPAADVVNELTANL